MKKQYILEGLIIFTLLFAISLISSEIIINQEPKEIYNLEDTITIPVTIKAGSDISGSFEMNLLCNARDENFYKNGIQLSFGQEKKLTPSLVLSREIIGESLGQCKIKSTLAGQEPQITNEFRISDLITLQVKDGLTDFNPGESIEIVGSAIKENGKDVNGFLNVFLTSPSGDEKEYLETISNGFFEVNISLNDDSQAGQYIVVLEAFERNFLGETTNKGQQDHGVTVTQIPTSLEIVFDSQEVQADSELLVKAILHDQTGEKISSEASIEIIDDMGIILINEEVQTDQSFEYAIPYNQVPSVWKVVAKSNELESESEFEITELKKVKTEIINKTLIITNVGNVFYNDTVFVKIQNDSLNVDVSLEIDGAQKYILNAPDGTYNIEILANGESYLSENVILTGKTVDVKKARDGVGSLVRYPIVWVFIIGIFTFVAFMVMKKGYKRSFFGYIYPKRKRKNAVPLTKKSLINTTNKAILTLSLKGEKQNSTVICMKIKNLKDIEKKKGNTEETLQKIVTTSENYKAVVYENQNNIFFVLAPIKTRTFKNDKPALELAQKIIAILKHHNKLFKQKIDYGISINNGNIVAKKQGDAIEFMSMGTLITIAKKIATISDGEIHLSEKIKDRLLSHVKTQKHKIDNLTYYTITQVKNADEHKKFINSFLQRIEKK